MNRRVTNRVLTPIWRVMPGFGILRHRGRRSGKTYETPVNLFRDGDEIVIALTYSSNSDWVKNVLAAGECGISTQGETLALSRPRLVVDREKTWAPAPVRIALNRLGVHEVLRFDAE